jgi:hypothetical protein
MSAHLVTSVANDTGGVDFKTIQPSAAQKRQLATLKAEFEKAFGADQESRTPDQWRNLVGRYGMETVCKTEKMKEKEVKKKMK